MNDNKKIVEYGKFVIGQYKNCFVATDKLIAQLYGIKGDNVFILPQGEVAKSFVFVQQLCSWLLLRGARRNDTLVAVGGGSVGDLVGFVASIYKRGMNFVNVPTTLLAMVDSSVGGKTGIDLDGIKNAVGSFKSGNVLVDTAFLTTLPVEQFNSGVGEIKKYCFLNKDIFDTFVSFGVNQSVIEKCVAFKLDIASQDIYDNGIRRILNLGHTVGHALELQYDLLHGQAVEYGLYSELMMALKLQLVSSSQANMLIDKLKLKAFQFDIDKCITAMYNDKKNTDNNITFCLPSGEFGTVIKSFDRQTLTELLKC